MKKLILILSLLLSTNAIANTEGEKCLAATIWAEARGEPKQGQIAVANVVLNRAYITDQSICQVVKEKHQFSWTNSKVEFDNAFRKSGQYLQLANDILMGVYNDPTFGATHFFSQGVPSWFKKGKQTVKIGNHTFMKGTYVVARRK